MVSTGKSIRIIGKHQSVVATRIQGSGRKSQHAGAIHHAIPHDELAVIHGKYRACRFVIHRDGSGYVLHIQVYIPAPVHMAIAVAYSRTVFRANLTGKALIRNQPGHPAAEGKSEGACGAHIHPAGSKRGILAGAGVLGCPAQCHIATLHIQRAGEIRQILPEDGSRGGRIGQVDDQLPGSAHRAEGGTDCIISTQAVILIDSDACPCIHDGSARERIGILHHQRSAAEQSQPAAAAYTTGTGKDEAAATDEHTAGLHRFRYQDRRGGGSGSELHLITIAEHRRRSILQPGGICGIPIP